MKSQQIKIFCFYLTKVKNNLETLRYFPKYTSPKHNMLYMPTHCKERRVSIDRVLTLYVAHQTKVNHASQ